ncbi:MAG TPA: S49 family peptidase [Lysobacter sp.]
MSQDELNDEVKNPQTMVEVGQNMYGLLAEYLGHLITVSEENRRWVRRKRIGMTILVGVGVILWVLLYGPMLGWSTGPATRSLGVVPIHGEIGDEYGANARQIVPAIEKACSSAMTQAVVLRITSPGGSPTDAERIAYAVDACRKGDGDRKGKPVIAVVETIGASAAYLIAVHADEVVATRYSMVGSIGAVMRSVDAEQAVKKFGLRERVFASGSLKARNSPFTANTPEQDALSQQLVDGVATMFAEEVRERRGAKLKVTPDMFSGRVWLSQEAVKLGLIDGTTTFEALHATRFKDLPVQEFRPTQTFQDKLGLSALARQFGAGLAAELSTTRVE